MLRTKEGHNRIVTTTNKPCSHHWIIEPPNGPWSLGTCNKCKEIDAFKNSMPETSWTGPPKKGRDKKNEIVTKEEFLSQREPELSPSNGSKYKTEFKMKVVQEVSIYGRTEVRKKYKIPETTLRSWVKLYS